jgi:hypothetical protein
MAQVALNWVVRARRRARRDGARLPARRGKIQEESLHYEHLKHTGEYPIIGVNTFRNPHGEPVPDHIELARSTEEEKQGQLKRLQDFQKLHAKQAPAMLTRLQKAVIENGNVFEVLIDAVRVCSLGQITNALFEVGGGIGEVCERNSVPFPYFRFKFESANSLKSAMSASSRTECSS